MKLCFKVFAVVAIAAATYSIIGCAAPTSFTYSNVNIVLTPTCTDCPVGILYNPSLPQPPNAGNAVLEPNTGEGGTYTWTAAVTNAPASSVTWAVYPQPNLGTPNPPPTGTSTPVGESGSSVGSFNTPAGSSTTAAGANVYFTVGSPPVYSGAALQQAQAMGIPQGDVMIVATVPVDPSNPSATVSTSQLIQIFGGTNAQGPPSVYLTPATPTTPSGLTNPVATITHGGGQYQFVGGVVGAAPCTTATACSAIGPNIPLNYTDNTPVWEVGPAPFSLATAVPGGDAIYGTISATGLYTAPATIPPTQPVVVLVSHLVPTVSKYAYININ